MKKVLLALSVIPVLVLSGASLAHAQVATSSSSTPALSVSIGQGVSGSGYDMPIHIAYLQHELTSDLQQLITVLQSEINGSQTN